MHKVVKVVDDVYGKNFQVDRGLFASVIADLVKNNTAFPEITNVRIEKKLVRAKENGKSVKKDGKVERVERDVMTVRFVDDSWVEVVRNPEDGQYEMVALVYALVKRLMGKPNANGYVHGSGFMRKLKDVLDNASTPKKDAETKAATIKAKEESDKKEHEKALERKALHPSIGSRLRDLEDKFMVIIDKLDKMTK